MLMERDDYCWRDGVAGDICPENGEDSSFISSFSAGRLFYYEVRRRGDSFVDDLGGGDAGAARRERRASTLRRRTPSSSASRSRDGLWESRSPDTSFEYAVYRRRRRRRPMPRPMVLLRDCDVLICMLHDPVEPPLPGIDLTIKTDRN